VIKPGEAPSNAYDQISSYVYSNSPPALKHLRWYPARTPLLRSARGSWVPPGRGRRTQDAVSYLAGVCPERADPAPRTDGTHRITDLTYLTSAGQRQ
jgi:hypothetical protein